MNKTEFYWPLSFIKNLKSVNHTKTLKILRLSLKIPFSKVASLRFTQILSEVEYKLSHADNFISETLKPDRATVRRN